MRFAGAPPPGYVLDALFASLSPLVTRWTEIRVAVQTTPAPDNVKSAWVGQLNQANVMLQNASIEGQLGQRLAMGDVTVEQWAATPEAAANLMEFIANETGTAGYSVPRLWREVVVPTAVEIGQKVPEIGQKVLDWGPIAIGAVAVGWLLLNFAPRRGYRYSGAGNRKRRR